MVNPSAQGEQLPTRACDEVASSWLEFWRLWLCGNAGPWGEVEGGGGGGRRGGQVGALRHAVRGRLHFLSQRPLLSQWFFLQLGGNQSWQQSWVAHKGSLTGYKDLREKKEQQCQTATSSLSVHTGAFGWRATAFCCGRGKTVKQLSSKHRIRKTCLC